MKAQALHAAGARIIVYRIKRQLSQSEFAARAGVARPVVSNLESGSYNAAPTLDSLAKIASFLGCSLADLLTHRHDSAHVPAAELSFRAATSPDEDINFDALLAALERKDGAERPRYSSRGRRPAVDGADYSGDR